MVYCQVLCPIMNIKPACSKDFTRTSNFLFLFLNFNLSYCCWFQFKRYYANFINMQPQILLNTNSTCKVNISIKKFKFSQLTFNFGKHLVYSAFHCRYTQWLETSDSLSTFESRIIFKVGKNFCITKNSVSSHWAVKQAHSDFLV